MPPDNAGAWNRPATSERLSARASMEAVVYGPDIPTEADLKLCGSVEGKRVLELGCGSAQCSVAFAKQGATAIGVDFSEEQLSHARELAERANVRVELRHGDLADLAFLRSDSVDLVFSSYAFGYVEDLSRVFRQVHRILKRGGTLVFSLPHPMYDLIDDSHPIEPLRIRRSYFDRTPIEYEWNGFVFTDYRHPIGELYSQLYRSNFRVDTILEPAPMPQGPRSPFYRETFQALPRTLILRARKEGL